MIFIGVFVVEGILAVHFEQRWDVTAESDDQRAKDQAWRAVHLDWAPLRFALGSPLLQCLTATGSNSMMT